MAPETTHLSSSVTVAKFKALEGQNDRAALAEFIRQRFGERYFDPVCTSSKPSGFAMMAVCCLVIETLESFYEGRPDTKRYGKETFRNFLDRDGPLNVFGKDYGNGVDWFYEKIRCGILHQSETNGGWRIHRKGDLLDVARKTINATRFLHALRTAVDVYADKLQTDEAVWSAFKKKMKAVCDNCV